MYLLSSTSPPYFNFTSGQALVNWTKVPLSDGEPNSWTLNPYAYSGKACYSENGSEPGYVGTGMLAAVFMAGGCALLWASLMAFIQEQLCAKNTVRDLEAAPLSANAADMGKAPPPPPPPPAQNAPGQV